MNRHGPAGMACVRPLCFFAHSVEEFREPQATANSWQQQRLARGLPPQVAAPPQPPPALAVAPRPPGSFGGLVLLHPAAGGGGAGGGDALLQLGPAGLGQGPAVAISYALPAGMYLAPGEAPLPPDMQQLQLQLAAPLPAAPHGPGGGGGVFVGGGGLQLYGGATLGLAPPPQVPVFLDAPGSAPYLHAGPTAQPGQVYAFQQAACVYENPSPAVSAALGAELPGGFPHAAGPGPGAGKRRVLQGGASAADVAASLAALSLSRSSPTGCGGGGIGSPASAAATALPRASSSGGSGASGTAAGGNEPLAPKPALLAARTGSV
jgi:hypothetical protein